MSTTLPNVMSRYLLMMAAIISVPPVLPFAEKATPIPPPQKPHTAPAVSHPVQVSVSVS